MPRLRYGRDLPKINLSLDDDPAPDKSYAGRDDERKNQAEQALERQAFEEWRAAEDAE